MKMSRVLLLAGGLFGTLPALSFAAEAAAPVRNVVLVHGAFADASGWDKVAGLLRKDGYKVTEVDNPLTSLEDDVAATQAVLAKQSGPVVLVGHSYGGVVIGEAGAASNVRALVYVAAFAPDKGESVQSLSAGGPPTPGLQAVRPDAKGYLSIDPAEFPKVFTGDLPAAEAQSALAHQIPINSAALGTPSVKAAWHDKPSYYAISAQDLMIPPQAEQMFAQRMAAKKIVTLQASHVAMISHPEEVTALIEEAAKAR